MKYLLLIVLFCSSSFAGTGELGENWRTALGTGDIGDNWRTSNVIEITTDLRDEVFKYSNVGDYNFDSYSDRWLLKTRSRVLSVKNLEILDKYHSKQEEVTQSKNKLKRVLRDKFRIKTFEKKATRMIKFKDYKLKDFSY